MKRIHILTDKKTMVCDEKGKLDFEKSTFYYLDDIAEMGKEEVIRASNMFYSDFVPCPECFDDENLNLYLLARY